MLLEVAEALRDLLLRLNALSERAVPGPT